MTNGSSRRRFLQAAGASAVACATASPRSALEAAGPVPVSAVPFTLGMASYTLRLFPVDQAIEMTKRLGLTRICFKDFHLKLDATPEQIAETVAKVRTAGLELYAGGVIYMKSEAEVDRAFAYAKAAGLKMIIGVPTYELLPYTNRKVQEYDIPSRFTTTARQPALPHAAERLRADRVPGSPPRPVHGRGHTQRSGIDPADSARSTSTASSTCTSRTRRRPPHRAGPSRSPRSNRHPEAPEDPEAAQLQGHAGARIREGREGPAAGLGRVDWLSQGVIAAMG